MAKNQNKLRDDSYMKIKHSIEKMKNISQKDGIERYIELYEKKTKHSHWITELKLLLNEKVKSKI